MKIYDLYQQIHKLIKQYLCWMSSHTKQKCLSKYQQVEDIKIQDFDTRSQPVLYKYHYCNDSTFKDQNYLDNSESSKPTYHENQLVCLSCLSDQFSLQQYIKEGLHQGHEIMRVSQAEIMLHKKMSQLDEKFQMISNSYSNNKDRIIKLKKQLLNTLKDLKLNLKKQFHDLKTTLQNKEIQIMRCAEIMISAKYENLDQSDQNLQKSLKNLTDLEDIFKQNNVITYQSYSLKKSKLDSLIIQSERLPQKFSIEIDFVPFSKIINEIEIHKNKIANIFLNNHMNTISLNCIAAQYHLYQDNKKFDTKKTYNRPTIASIGDDYVHNQYSSSLFLSQAKKLIEDRNSSKEPTKRLTSPKALNNKQKQGGFQDIIRLNSHRDNFHSREKLQDQKSRSNKLVQVENYLKQSFRK